MYLNALVKVLGLNHSVEDDDDDNMITENRNPCGDKRWGLQLSWLKPQAAGELELIILIRISYIVQSLCLARSCSIVTHLSLLTYCVPGDTANVHQ